MNSIFKKAAGSGSARLLQMDEEGQEERNAFSGLASEEEYWRRLRRRDSPAAARIDDYFFSSECLMDEGFIHRLHEKGCKSDSYFLLDPQVCGAVGAPMGRHCPVENMTIYMSDMTSGWQIESQVGSLIAFTITIMTMQLGGVPSPYGIWGKVAWGTWMLVQATQLVVTLLSIVLIVKAFFVSLSLLDECNNFTGAFGMPVLSIFFLTTLFFQPVVLLKFMTSIMYWLSLYMGGRAWELRPGKGTVEGEEEEEGQSGTFM